MVAAGYDLIAERYATHTLRVRRYDSTYRRFLDRCLDLVPVGGRVLDLGCGAGIPAAEIARRATVVGVDLSFEQLRLAHERVPAALLVRADMSQLELRPASFDAIAAFWSLIHVRRDLHAELLMKMHHWLRPAGVIFGTFGSGDNPDERDDDFFGGAMCWSHFDADTNVRLLNEAGFTIIEADIEEDRAGEHPLWVTARA